MNVTIGKRTQHYRTVWWEPRRHEVRMIEQRLLPHTFQIVATRSYIETARAIRDMAVRGAGAIAATAAFGLAQGACAFRGKSMLGFQEHVESVFQTLLAARPTAIDPLNAMREVRVAMNGGATVREQQERAVTAALRFADENVAHCQAIGRRGAALIKQGARVLTHCNAGWLAFVDVGSATAPLYAAQSEGRIFHVFCSETRPRCQGASLTAWELAHQKISHEIIADTAAGHLMQRGEVDLVIVGSDRTLGRTGDVANKIGTYTNAVLAKRHGIPVYVTIPLSTIDWNLKSGFDIPIEERSEEEVLGAYGVTQRGKREYCRIANPSSPARNPGFDVTSAELITGIITPKGIFKPNELWKHRRRLGFA